MTRGKLIRFARFASVSAPYDVVPGEVDVRLACVTNFTAALTLQRRSYR